MTTLRNPEFQSCEACWSNLYMFSEMEAELHRAACRERCNRLVMGDHPAFTIVRFGTLPTMWKCKLPDGHEGDHHPNEQLPDTDIIVAVSTKRSGGG